MSTNSLPLTSTRYYIATMIAVLGWGLSTTFIEFGLPFINPYAFLALRFSVAVIITTPIIFLTRFQELKIILKTRWVYLIALCETTGLLFQYEGQNRAVSAGLASLLTMMFILIVPILSYRLLQEKFHLNHALAILIGFVGVFFIITEGDLSRLASSSTIGIIVLLLSAVSYAFYQISTSKYTREVNSSVDSFALFYVVMVMISGYSLLASIVNSTFTLEIVSDAWLWIVMLAIFSTILAFVGYFEAAKGIPVNTLSIFLMLQMLVPFFVDIFFLGKTYSLWIYTGGFLIVLGMVFVTRIPLEKPMEVPSIS